MSNVDGEEQVGEGGIKRERHVRALQEGPSSRWSDVLITSLQGNKRPGAQSRGEGGLIRGSFGVVESRDQRKNVQLSTQGFGEGIKG